MASPPLPDRLSRERLDLFVEVLDAIIPPDGRPTTVEDLTNIINIPELPKPTLDPEPETDDEETPPPAPPTDTGDKDQDATP